MRKNNEFEEDIYEDEEDQEMSTEVEMVKKENKFVGFVKKHGKKVVGGLALAGAAVLGYAIGHKTSDGGDYYEEVDVIDLNEDCSESEVQD